jgi:protein tyrosine phosphatase
MNPIKFHPMKMDPMIFEFNAGVYATSLYLLICSLLDEGQKPTLNQALPAWNSTQDNLVEAVKELSGFRILKPMASLDYDEELLLNPRENWSWCKAAGGLGRAV